MELTLWPAYDRAEELRPLYEAYAAMLVAGDPVFAASLAQQHYDEELAHLGEKYAPPGGRIYLLTADGEAAGCVGLRRIDSDTGELKRLYVRPAFRGRALGRLLTERIIADARAAGYRRLRLDTLPFLTHAIALYRALGFYDIDCYYDCLVPGTIFMELSLD